MSNSKGPLINAVACFYILTVASAETLHLFGVLFYAAFQDTKFARITLFFILQEAESFLKN
jgi:hypothetical protein